MVRIGVCALCVAFLFVTGCKSEPPIPKSWIRWTNDSWGVSIAFPFKPESRAAKSLPGVVRSEAFLCKSNDVYDLICVELLDAPTSPERVKKSFESVVQSITSRSNSKLVKSWDSPLDGYKGKFFQFETPDGRIYQVRVLLKGYRTYTMSAVTTKGKAESSEVKQFFDSIQFK